MISIIIPTFNRANLIGETFYSLMNQTFKDFEVLVIDDHSTDNIEEVIKEFTVLDSRIKFFKRPDELPKGGNSCRNYGFETSKGDYIKWLDSDDLLAVNCLEIQINDIIVNNSDVSICDSKVFRNSKNGHPLEILNQWGSTSFDPTISNFLSFQFQWHTSSSLWRKSYFKELPIWEENLTNSQEWIMHFKQLLHSVKISKIGAVLCFARSHSGNMSNKKNKSSKYYFNECKARGIVFQQLVNYNINISSLALKKISKQFFWYQLYCLYKMGFIEFFKIFGFYSWVLKYYYNRFYV